MNLILINFICSFPFFFFLNLINYEVNFFLNFYLFIYLFMAVLGLRFCARAFSSCGKQGPLFITVHRPLTITASLVAEHRLQTRRLSSCGSRAQLLCGMWDLPRSGLEPMSPALAGRFSTTAPPGKPPILEMNPTWLCHSILLIYNWILTTEKCRHLFQTSMWSTRNLLLRGEEKWIQFFLYLWPVYRVCSVYFRYHLGLC